MVRRFQTRLALAISLLALAGCDAVGLGSGNGGTDADLELAELPADAVEAYLSFRLRDNDSPIAIRIDGKKAVPIEEGGGFVQLGISGGQLTLEHSVTLPQGQYRAVVDIYARWQALPDVLVLHPETPANPLQKCAYDADGLHSGEPYAGCAASCLSRENTVSHGSLLLLMRASGGVTLEGGGEYSFDDLRIDALQDAFDDDGDTFANRDEVLWQTDPCRADTDGDGLQDAEEDKNRDGRTGNRDQCGNDRACLETSVWLTDTDGDGFADGVETGVIVIASDGTSWESVGRWRSEQDTGTDPLDPDTDGDSLLDGSEVVRLYNEVVAAGGTCAGTDNVVSGPCSTLPPSFCGSDPTLADSDGDGVTDDVELAAPVTNPMARDTDNDSVADGEELSTDALVCDSDGDGLSDGDELRLWLTDPADADSDDDILLDGEEVNGDPPTDPLLADTDGDGLTDGDELHNDGTTGDTDGELTDPLSPDSDGDLVVDGRDPEPNNADVTSPSIFKVSVRAPTGGDTVLTAAEVQASTTVTVAFQASEEITPGFPRVRIGSLPMSCPDGATAGAEMVCSLTFSQSAQPSGGYPQGPQIITIIAADPSLNVGQDSSTSLWVDTYGPVVDENTANVTYEANGCDVAAGLVAHYPMEVATSVTPDASGKNNDLVLAGSALAEGRYGAGLSALAGTGPFAAVDVATIPQGSDPYSLALWIDARTLPVTSSVLLSIGDGGCGLGPWLGLDAAGSVLGGDGCAASVTGTAAPVGAEQWHHVALTYDGADARLYLDGAEVGTVASLAGALSGTTIFLGGHASVGERFDGTTDDVRVYDRALAAAEVAALQLHGPSGMTPVNTPTAATVCSTVVVTLEVDEEPVLGSAAAQLRLGGTVIDMAPVSATLVSVQFAAQIESAAIDQGAYDMTVTLADRYGNTSTQNGISGAEITIDTVAPAAPDTDPSLVIHHREPWGSNDSPALPRQWLDVEAGAVEPGGTVLVYSGDNPLVAQELSRGPSDATGAALGIAVEGADRAALYVAFADGAGNLSEAREVIGGAWTASLGNKVAGSVVENPHSAFSVNLLGTARDSAEAVELSSAQYGALIQVDPSHTSALGTIGRWSREETFPTPPNFAGRLPAYDPIRDRVLLTYDHAGWNASSRSWTPDAEVNLCSINPDCAPWRMHEPDVVYDFKRDQYVRYGGLSSDLIPDGTHEELDGESYTWADRTGISSPSLWRGGLAFDAARGELLSFGGCDIDGFPEWGSVIRYWTGSQWELKCMELTCEGGSPAPRCENALVYNPHRATVLMYGGSSALDAADLSDLWEWNGRRWTSLCDPASGCPAPPPRALASATFDARRGVLVVSGGHDSTGTPLSDTWEWDGVAWTEVCGGATTCAGLALDSEPALYMPSLGYTIMGDDAFDGQAFWALDGLSSFGSNQDLMLGFDQGRGVAIVHIDAVGIWEWDGYEWSRPCFGVSCALARAEVDLVYDPINDWTMVFGGEMAGNARGEQWAWDGVSWFQVCTAAPCTRPPARRNAGAALDESRATVVMLGGTDTAGTPFDELWEWDGVNWQLECGGASGCVNPAGLQLVDPQLVYDPYRQTVVLGHDLWEWNGTAWNDLCPADDCGTAPAGATGFAIDERGHLLAVDPVDTNIFADGAWSRPCAAGKPCGASLRGSNLVLAYDPFRGEVLGHESGDVLFGDNRTLYWDSAAHERPAVVFKVDLSEANAADAEIERVVVFAAAGATGYDGAATNDGVSLLSWRSDAGGTWAPIATSSAAATASAAVQGEIAGRGALAGAIQGLPGRRTMGVALASSAPNGRGTAEVVADYIDAQVSYCRGGCVPGFLTSYHRWFPNVPEVMRTEPALSYDWGDTAPVPEVTNDQFSVVWEGSLHVGVAGSYAFTVQGDNYAVVGIDGSPLMDGTPSATTTLTAGWHRIVVRGYDFGGPMSIELRWSGPDTHFVAQVVDDRVVRSPRPNYCGNGVLENGEGCDDGNTAPGDGCDAACQVEMIVCDTAPEGQRVSLSCPMGTTVAAVDFASFGRPRGSCGSFSQASCSAANSRIEVESACLGQSTCTVTANAGSGIGMFDSACRGVAQWLSVQVRCE